MFLAVWGGGGCGWCSYTSDLAWIIAYILHYHGSLFDGTATVFIINSIYSTNPELISCVSRLQRCPFRLRPRPKTCASAWWARLPTTRSPWPRPSPSSCRWSRRKRAASSCPTPATSPTSSWTTSTVPCMIQFTARNTGEFDTMNKKREKNVEYINRIYAQCNGKLVGWAATHFHS